MRNPFRLYRLDEKQENAFERILNANPFKGEDLRLFERDARHLLLMERLSPGEPLERVVEARQKVWTVHILTKSYRSLIAGLLLGGSVGLLNDQIENPFARFGYPAAIAATLLRWIDMGQFKRRTRRAVPEFWEPPKN